MLDRPQLRLVDNSASVFQFHVLLHGINPPVWRRIQMRSDHTLADLHFAIQMAMGWSNVHLQAFKIRGKGYSDWRSNLAGEKDIDRFRLGDFRFRPRERFLYEYNFTDGWRTQVRFEKTLPLQTGRKYPVCIGRSRAAPPEDCGGAWAYMEMKDEHHLNYPREDIRLVCDAVLRVLDAKGENAREAIGDMEAFREAAERAKEYFEFRPWRFDRRRTNKRLRYYAEGDERWKWQE